MTETKRIYIGGLFPGVTKEDIAEKFVHFGKVSQVDIKVKKSTQGEAIKTFAYVNIEIAGGKLNKCLGTFNNTKWKGSQLKLQVAKENFIDRLQAERDHPVEIPVKPKKVKKSSFHNPLENLPDPADFHLKGATPGTVIEGEKNWVVGKYGRVLPIVYIRRKDKKKIMKVDPSKFCHNIKHHKDDATTDLKQNAKSLTWEMDDIKSDNYLRRQGVFPEWHPPKKIKKTQELPKKIVREQHVPTAKVLHSESLSGEDIFHISGTKHEQRSVYDDDTEVVVVSNERRNKKPVQFNPKAENNDSDGDSISSTNTDDIIAAAKDSRVFRDSSSGDDDSGEIEEAQVSVKQKSLKTEQNAVKSEKKMVNNSSKNVKSKLKEDNKSLITKVKKEKQNTKQTERISLNIKNETNTNSVKSEVKSKQEDCIKSEHVINSKELNSNESTKIKQKEPVVLKSTVQSMDDILAELLAGNHSDSDSDDKLSRKKKKPKRKQWKPPEFKGTSFLVAVTDSSKDEASDLSNIHRLSQSHDSTVKNISNLNTESQMECIKIKKPTKEENVTVSHKEERDNSIHYSSSGKSLSQREQLEKESDIESDDSRNTDEIIADSKSNTKKDYSHTSKFTAVKLKSEKNQSFTSERLTLLNEFASGMNLPQESVSTDNNKGDEYDSEDYEKLLTKPSVVKLPNKRKIEDDFKLSMTQKTDSPISDSQKEIISNVKTTIDTKVQVAVFCKKTKSKGKGDSGGKEKEEVGKAKDKKLLRKDGTPKPGNKKIVDNAKRMESLKQKVDENRNQKEAIRKALSSVDKPSKFMNKKILFDSDEDEDDMDEASDGVCSRNDGSQSEDSEEEIETREDKKAELFGSSDESDNEAETNREDDFRLRPQFEGAKGSKLMALQSRYANDERFKLDEKFMESDEEGEDVQCLDQPDAEKRQSLKILEAVVGHRLRGIREKEKKQFKDVTGLHFDPDRDDHSRFEIKADSKAAKGKKKSVPKEEESVVREQQPDPPSSDEKDETDSAPTASTERFYEVASSIKDAFKSNDGFSLLAAFGDDENNTGDQNDIEPDEPIKKPFLFSSQQQFDSSDDEEGVSQEAVAEENTEMETDETKTVIFPAKKATFFFTENDDRIKEGIQYFKRPIDMESLHEMWQAKRPDLVEAYRQKRKKVLRKQKDQERQKPAQHRRATPWKKQ